MRRGVSPGPISVNVRLLSADDGASELRLSAATLLPSNDSEGKETSAMMRIFILGLAAMLMAAPPAAPQKAEPSAQTWTGWFSDKRCAKTPAAGESVRPNGTDCVKKCLHEGSTPVFLSEQTNALYDVQDHAAVKDDVGYRVEVTGVVDEKANTIAVRSVKRLSQVTAMCMLPKRGPKK
jgi:hypothetical protein